MPDLDLRAEFAKLCADMPAGDAGENSYEETLGVAVHRLVRRTYGHHAGFSMRQMNEAASPALDCPFMMSVIALPFDSEVNRAPSVRLAISGTTEQPHTTASAPDRWYLSLSDQQMAGAR